MKATKGIVRGALLALAVTAPLFASGATAQAAGLVAAAPAQPADSCTSPYIAILPSTRPDRDMALGFQNGTSNLAHVADRDSSGISRAEMWRELPVGDGSVVLQNQNFDTGVWNAAMHLFDGPVTKTQSQDIDNSMRWRKTPIGNSQVRYSVNGKNLAYLAGGQGFQLVEGSTGDQKFIRQVISCT
jgi:hypothetical protein